MSATPWTHPAMERAYQQALNRLLTERAPEGYWSGELSTSALSTAVAVSALAVVQQRTAELGSFDALIQGGLRWLTLHQNRDGGWGDTVRSFSNISTTMLCRAAFHMAGDVTPHYETLRRADDFMAEHYGPTPEQHAEAVRARYGKDRTFSVPILVTGALAGLVSWREVPALPFELACFPQAWFRFLRLPVVSYALPALIAIGQTIYHHRPPRNPLTRLIRYLAREKSLHVLQTIQPSNGGFLEATPLTSFVTMSLASAGRAEHPVVRKGVEFIVQSVRPDGSWPIDTNLSTWVTTLSINALAAGGELDTLAQRVELRDWLLQQQYRERHPFTGAAPGGFSWTPLPGAVPDADDTPGALLAFHELPHEPAHLPAIFAGLNWLADLQNSDGGWPTFCRGWTKLPFDRSGADLTAHALRALAAWTRRLCGRLPGPQDRVRWKWTGNLPPEQKLFRRLSEALPAGLTYLARTQRPDGSWLPLWFGNQYAPDDENPTYGTARVLAAYRDLELLTSEPARKALSWLVRTQNEDGGWGAGPGTPSSIEETALAIEALLEAGAQAENAVQRGLLWLSLRVESGALEQATPIGFYFAKLWYFEKLYPIVFTVAALGRARRRGAGS